MPDLSRLNEAAETYWKRHRRAIEEGDFQGRVMASWGLIARGRDALPFLGLMLREGGPKAREDAAGAYAWIAEHDPSVVDELLAALEHEVDTQARDSIVVALGELRAKAAIPALARLIEAPDTDGDTRFTAIQSLGRIVRRRFDRQAEPEAAAKAWLAAHR